MLGLVHRQPSSQRQPTDLPPAARWQLCNVRHTPSCRAWPARAWGGWRRAQPDAAMLLRPPWSARMSGSGAEIQRRTPAARGGCPRESACNRRSQPPVPGHAGRRTRKRNCRGLPWPWARRLPVGAGAPTSKAPWKAQPLNGGGIHKPVRRQRWYMSSGLTQQIRVLSLAACREIVGSGGAESRCVVRGVRVVLDHAGSKRDVILHVGLQLAHRTRGEVGCESAQDYHQLCGVLDAQSRICLSDVEWYYDSSLRLEVQIPCARLDVFVEDDLEQWIDINTSFLEDRCHRHNRGRSRVPHGVDVPLRREHVVNRDVVAGVASRGRNAVHLRAPVAGVAIDVVLCVPLEVLDPHSEVLICGWRDIEETCRNDLVDRRRVEAVAHGLAPCRARLVELQGHRGRGLACRRDRCHGDDRRREVQREAARGLREQRCGCVVFGGLWVNGSRALHQLVVLCGAVHVILRLHGETGDLDFEVLVHVVPIHHMVLEDWGHGAELTVERRVRTLSGGVCLAICRPRLVQLQGHRDRRLLG
mmetsp:Transcript_89585/g.248783  ORF Transcript_89585/g.248783 Transcript_89585/m.248783 type:complete len:530 (-) Transcript_89585:808-2397(-)